MAPFLRQVIRRSIANRPFADRVLCHFLTGRLKLPALSLPALFADFNEQPVVLGQLPLGCWSTPMADVVMLLKLVLCAKPQRAMEVGSYRGYTALGMAKHLPPASTLVTVDRYPEHGEAYRNSPLAAKIERRVGETGAEMFRGDAPGSYDLIFVDADHLYEGVRRDTEVLLPLVSPTGFIVWHDYANWGYFNTENGVPEYLGELSARHTIGHVFNTDLAIHSPAWDTDAGRAAFNKAVVADTGEIESDPWNADLLRG